MKLFPKVTVDSKVYIEHCIKDTDIGELDLKCYVKLLTETVKACYFDNMVWLRKLSAFTLLHEYIHHAVRTLFKYPTYGNLTLFSDFIDTFFDGVWGIVCCKDWRKHTWDIIDDIKEDWGFFRDFQFCIDFEDE